MMTTDMVFCYDDQDVSEAARVMQEKLIRDYIMPGYAISWDGANYASLGPLYDTVVHFTYGYGAYTLQDNVGGAAWATSESTASGNATHLRVEMGGVGRQCSYVHE